jgi:hypothetical protein
MKSILYSLIIFFVIIINSVAFSQFHFGIKNSAKDIYAQRELFENAKVQSAVIHFDNLDEKIMFDRAGKIIGRVSYASDNENEIDGEEIYEYDYSGNLILIRTEGGMYMEPTIFQYDSLGNMTKRITDSHDLVYFYDKNNNFIGTKLLRALSCEVIPIDSIKYSEGLICEIKYGEFTEGDSPYDFVRELLSYDEYKRLIEIAESGESIETGKPIIISRTKIEYNEKNLPISYISTDILGNINVCTIIYRYF